jgi:hypothetical protein
MIDIKALLTTKAFQMGVVAGVSGTLSAFISYRVTKRYLDNEYREIIDTEIIEARRFYSTLNKRDAYASPELVVKQVGLDNAVQALNDYQGNASEVEPEIEEEFKRERQGNWTTAEAPALKENEFSPLRPIPPISMRRDTTAPYVISIDEFMEATDADARAQITLTYYSDDDVLTDDKDIPIDDIDETIGTENLSHFGEGSGDGRIVYIRNEHMDVDFEVILHQGNYAELVHGIAKEPRRRARKFRGEDG